MAAKTNTNSRKKIEMAPLSLEGQSLGKYRILEPLGRGGMAQVFKAYHPQLDRYVAVKILRSDLVEDEEFLARFRREARAVAALRHPNIVQIFDFDVQDDLYYMVMELLEGDTLKAYLNTLRVDTLLVAGFVTCGCIRSAVIDAFSYNYYVAVPEDAVADRMQISHYSTLLDLDMKYADVEPLENVLGFLQKLQDKKGE